MEYFFLIIIGIAVISMISGAAKKKAREEAARRAAQGQGQQGQEQPQQQAPRGVPLSDIQKAFMMAQNSAPPQVAPRPAYTPPQAAPRPAYTPPQPAPQPVYAPVQATQYATMEARTIAPMEARTTYAAQNIYRGSMNAVSPEGTSDVEGSGPPLVAAKYVNLKRVTDDDLETITALGAPVRQGRKAASAKPASTGLPRLFGNKNEILKAVVYAEILAPKSSRRA